MNVADAERIAAAINACHGWKATPWHSHVLEHVEGRHPDNAYCVFFWRDPPDSERLDEGFHQINDAARYPALFVMEQLK